MPASPEAGSTRPRRKILSGIALTLALFASLMAFMSSPVSAVQEQPRDAECYVQVEVSKYKRQTYETKYTYTKYVSGWYRYTSPSGWSEYANGAWTQTVTTGGEPHPYLSSAGNPIGSDGLLHQTAGSWKRNYRYQITSQEQVATGWEYSDWVTESPGEGWVLHDTKTVKGDTFPCPDASATPGTCEGPGEITPSTSEHYTHEITDGVVTFTAVPPAVFGGDVQTVFDLSETVAQLEGEQCDEEVTPADPEVAQSTECEVEGELVIPNTGGVKYLLDGEEIAAGSHTGPISGTLTAEALDGHKLTNPEWSFEVDIAAAEDCPYDVSASLSYECDADVTVTLTSEGATEFEISVNGEVAATETVSDTENVVVTIDETSTIVVTANGEEILDEVVEYVDCGDVLGDDEEASEEDENGDVAGDDAEAEASEETGATTLPMTGASAGLLTLLAGMAMGLGTALRTISRRFD
jgi:hypothetical protein